MLVNNILGTSFLVDLSILSLFIHVSSLVDKPDGRDENAVCSYRQLNHLGSSLITV